MTAETGRATTRFRLSQEMIAIVTVGLALAALILVTVADLREEGQADRAAWQAESRQYRDEVRASREAFQRKSEAWQREILRIREAQARPAGVASPRPGEQQ